MQSGEEYGGYGANLWLMTDGLNQSKGDDDAAEWLPPYEAAVCGYVKTYVAVKVKWELSIDEAEKAALMDVALGCRGSTTTGAAPTQASEIEEGVWTVGVDILPGTYRVTDAVADRCYWAITKSGTNGDDIISNDMPSGGWPSVTLQEGQDFESHRCGTWQQTR